MAIFLAKILPQKMAKLLTLLFFTLFLLKLVFFQKSHSPCRKKKIFEKQLNTTKIEKKMAKLLTLHGQDINSTAYIYTHIVFSLFLSSISLSLSLFSLSLSLSFFFFLSLSLSLSVSPLSLSLSLSRSPLSLSLLSPLSLCPISFSCHK